MIPIGFAVAWTGYAAGMFGYCLVKGYGITFTQIVSPTKFWKQAWPPGIAENTSIFPTGGGQPPAKTSTPTTSTTSAKTPAKG